MTLNTLGICGTVLVWIGLAVCAASLTLFVAVGKGVCEKPFSYEGTMEEGALVFHSSDSVHLGLGERLLFLSPLAAGLILVASGVGIHCKVPELQKVLTETGHQFQKEHEADSEQHGFTE